MKTIKVQLGNKHDTTGARLVEAIHVADIHYQVSSQVVFLYNNKGNLSLCVGRMNSGPDFPESEAYSARAARIDSEFVDVEREFGVSLSWLRSYGLLDAAKELQPTPIAVHI